MAYIRFTNDGWYTKAPLDEVVAGAVRIADACAQLWTHDRAGSTCYVGLDTRPGSAVVAQALAHVLVDAGFEVVMPEGPCPMPAVCWAVAQDERAAGALIASADHRSASYLGVRIRDSRGRALDPDDIQVVERLMTREVATAAGEAPVTRRDLTGPFLCYLRDLFDVARPEPIRCVVDPLYGTARGIARSFLCGLGVDATQIHGDAVEGFADLHPDAVEPWIDGLEREVRARGADIGIALDGPANRCAIVDERGQVVPLPKVHALVMAHLVEDRHLTGRVVLPRTTSYVVFRQAQRLGLEVVDVGQERVWARDEVDSGGVLTNVDVLGGLRVPMFDANRDALVTALCVLELMATRGMGLSALVAELDSLVGTSSYGRRELRLDAAQSRVIQNLLPGLNPGPVGDREVSRMSHADGLGMRFRDDSWFLIRASESEPLVRIIAEAPTRGERDELLDAAESVVDEAVGHI